MVRESTLKVSLPKGRICCCRVRVSYNGVRLHSIIKLIGLNIVSDYELVVWDFEIALMKKAYIDLEVEYVEGYAYQMRMLPWRRFYSDNYSKRLEAKKNKDNFGIAYYKLLNNSSYGKLLEKPHNDYFCNIINSLGIIDSEIIHKGVDELSINAKYTYLPVGSCIPAYSRVALISLALKIGYEKVCYFDTDSIFFLYDEESWKVWESVNQEDFLGGWALEEMIDRAQFTAPKRYKTLVDGKLSVKAGGMNFKQFLITNGYDSMDEVPYEEVNITSSNWEVQRSYRCKGGTLIHLQQKKMEVPKKYVDIYKKNMLE